MESQKFGEKDGERGVRVSSETKVVTLSLFPNQRLAVALTIS
jgi:hypothetical protein